MGDTSGCQINSNNLAVYIQGVSVTPSSNVTSEYFVTGSLPSSASTKRVWSFTTQGTISGTQGFLTLDYTEAKENCPLYNISFENKLNGTFIVKNQVFSANKFISYQFDGDTILTLTIKIPKTILNCYGSEDPLPYYFTTNINDVSTSTINLVYGTDSSGTGYTYVSTGDAPDTLSVSSSLNFVWSSIATGDAVDVEFGSSTAGSILYYGQNPTSSSYYVEYLSDASGATTGSGGVSLIDFGSTADSNWAFYYDYTNQSSYPIGGGGTFLFNYGGSSTSEFTIPSDSSGSTFTFEIVNASRTDIYIVVGNISAGEIFTVTQTGGGYNGFNVNGYDILENPFSYKTGKQPASTTYTYTGTGWYAGIVTALLYGTDSSGTGYTYVSTGNASDTLSVSSPQTFVWGLIATGDAVDVQFGSITAGSILYYGQNPTSSSYYVEYLSDASGATTGSGGVSLIDFGSTADSNWAFYFDYTNQSSYPIGGGGTFLFNYGSSSTNDFLIPSDSSDNTFTFEIINATVKDIYVVVGNISAGEIFTVTQTGGGYNGFNVNGYDILGNPFSYITTGTPTSTTYTYTGTGWYAGIVTALLYGTDSSGTGYTYVSTGNASDTLSVSSPQTFVWGSIATGDAVDVQFGSITAGSILYYGQNPTSSSYYVEYLSDALGTTGSGGVSLIDFGSTAESNWAFYYDYTNQSNYPIGGGGVFLFNYGSSSTNDFLIPSDSSDNTFTFEIINATVKDIYVVVGNITAGELFTVTQTGGGDSGVNVNGYDISGNSFSYTTTDTPTSTTYTYTGTGWYAGIVTALLYGTDSSGTGYTYVSTSNASDTLSVSSPQTFVWGLIATGDAVDVQFGSITAGSILYYGQNPTSSSYYVEYLSDALGTTGSGGVSLIDFGSTADSNWAFYYDYTNQSSYPIGGGGTFLFNYGSSTNDFLIPSDSSDNTFTFEIINATVKDIYVVVGNISAGELFTVTQTGGVYSGFNINGYDISGNPFRYTTIDSPASTSYEYTGSGWQFYTVPLVYGTDSSGTGYTYVSTGNAPDTLSVTSSVLPFSWSSIATGDAVDVQFASARINTLLYYGPSPTSSSSYVQYLSDALGTTGSGGVSLIDFGSTADSNWAFYYDYANQSNYPIGGGGTFLFYYGNSSNTNEFTIPSDSTGFTFTFEIVIADVKEIYIVVGNITKGDLFTVTQTGEGYSGFNVNGYDISGNPFNYTTTDTPTSTTYTYTGSGWTLS